MKMRFFYQAFALAVITFLIVALACNSPEKELPSYIEKAPAINDMDRRAIIDSYEQGTNDKRFIDSASRGIVDERAKKIVVELSDFYSDLNGHLKSLAMDRRIELERSSAIQKALSFTSDNNGSDAVSAFISEMRQRLKKEIGMFNDHKEQTTDAEVKKYFDSSAILLQQQLARLDTLTASTK